MMASFSKLPCEIKEIIFSRIRIKDLYEVSAVSEEWFWLSIKSYKGILSEEEPLIKSLLNFYNREKKLTTPLVWFQLVKYCNFCDVKLNHLPLPMVLENFLESRRPIRSLCLQMTVYRLLESHKTKLDDLLKYFPHLEAIELLNLPLDPNSLRIPKGIKRVNLSRITDSGVDCSSLFEDPDSIQSLRLFVKGLNFDHCPLKNLTSLSLDFASSMTVQETKTILDLIRSHKHLRSVKLFGATITKEWFNLFGSNIENISLKYIYVENELLTELGTDGCYERRLMSYICSDWTTVKRFTLALSWTVNNNDFEEDISLDYRGVYTCRPQLMKEKLFLGLDSRLSRQVRTITTTDVGPALHDLYIKYSHTVIKPELLTNCVPVTVKKLKMELDAYLGNLSIAQLCQQPQNLEDSSIQRVSFTSCTQLKILEMTNVNREGIQNLLQHCVCLEMLTLKFPEEGSFTDLCPTIVSKTIREVNLDRSDARLEDILYHCPNLEVLRLSSHLILPTSLPAAITKLNLFSAVFLGLSDLRSNYRRLALLLDTVEVPCKLFHASLYKNLFSFKLGWTDSISEEFEHRLGFAYCFGIPTRFLEARGIKILDGINQFFDN